MVAKKRTRVLNPITIRAEYMQTIVLYILAFTMITTGNAAQYDAILLRGLTRHTYQKSQNNIVTGKQIGRAHV